MKKMSKAAAFLVVFLPLAAPAVAFADTTIKGEIGGGVNIGVAKGEVKVTIEHTFDKPQKEPPQKEPPQRDMSDRDFKDMVDKNSCDK